MDFSSMVDKLKAGSSVDPCQLEDIMNGAIRHVGRVTSYGAATEEVCLELGGQGSSLSWQIPNARKFMRFIYAEDFSPLPISIVKPSQKMSDVRAAGLPYGYRNNDVYTFGNIYGGVRFSYATHPRNFEYIPKEGRQQYAYYDPIQDTWLGDPTTKSMVTCPLIEAYYDLIMTRARLEAAALSDDPTYSGLRDEWARKWQAITYNE